MKIGAEETRRLDTEFLRLVVITFLDKRRTRMSKDLHASMRAAAKLTAEDTDEMDNTHTVVRAAYAARVEDDGNC